MKKFLVLMMVCTLFILSACDDKNSPINYEGVYVAEDFPDAKITLKSNNEFEQDLVLSIIEGTYKISGSKITLSIKNSTQEQVGAIKGDTITLAGVKYVKETIYIVSFNTDGGSSILQQAVKKNDKVEKPATPTKGNKYFINWYKDEIKTKIFDFNTKITSNIILYASWSDTCQITFNKNLGTNGTDVVSAIYNQNMPVATAPTRENYIFLGYFDDSTSGQKYYNADMSSAKKWDKHEWATLYAQWIYSPEYTAGLIFTLSSNGNNYYVTGYTGNSENVVIPAVYLNKPVIGIDYEAFKGKSILKNITIPDSISTIGMGAFENCINLTNITIGPNSTLTKISARTFVNCSKLTSIFIPNSVKRVDSYTFNDSGIWNSTTNNSVVYAGKWAVGFKGTAVSVTFKSDTIGLAGSIFHNSRTLISVVLNNGLLYIDDEVFYDCMQLTSIIIPNSVISIGYEVFSWSNNIKNITIPATVITMGASVFNGWDDSQTIHIKGSTSSWDNDWARYCDANLDWMY